MASSANFFYSIIKTKLYYYNVNCICQGVTTTDILTAYIQSIQALRVLDPSCVILEIVTEPVKEYLRYLREQHNIENSQIFVIILCVFQLS